jgi:hypothetical protein
MKLLYIKTHSLGLSLKLEFKDLLRTFVNELYLIWFEIKTQDLLQALRYTRYTE